MVQTKPIIDDFKIQAGVDIPVDGLGLVLRQPRLREIAMLGEMNYFTALSIFTTNKKTLIKNYQNQPTEKGKPKPQIPQEELDKITDWSVFNQALEMKIPNVLNTRTLVSNFLTLFFGYKVLIMPTCLIVQDPNAEGGTVNIEEDDFPMFQDLIGRIGGKVLLTGSEDEYNPKNKLAAEIAEKMRRAHERLRRVKAAENGGSSAEEGFLSRYMRAICLGYRKLPEEVNNMTLLQAAAATKIFLSWESYDLDIRARIAGAKGDKDIQHWMLVSPYNDDSGIGTI